MYIPYSHERVFRKGRTGVYVVVWVDFYHQNVSLIPIEGERPGIVENVPFFELEPVDRVGLSSVKSNVSQISNSR